MSSTWKILLTTGLVAALCVACGGGSAGGTSAGSSATPVTDSSGAPIGGSTPSPPTTPSAPTGAAALVARFTAPANGQFHVSPTAPVTWNAVAGASYELQVGTTPGGNDLYESGIITSTSVVVPGLPRTGVVYARVRAIPSGWATAAGGHWLRGDNIAFSMDGTAAGATLRYPSAQGQMVAGQGFSWTTDPLAVWYHLSISNAQAQLVYQTGDLRSTRALVANLPVGVPLTATLDTIYVDHITSTQVGFSVADATISAAQQITFAQALTGDVRAMADFDNQPLGGSPLQQIMLADGNISADCSTFTVTLLNLLADASVTLPYTSLATCFNSAPNDCHALVTLYDTDSGRTTMLDPTFGVVPLGADGRPATPQEVSAAARTQNWTALQYQYVTPAADAYLRGYYLDYPVLFLNLYGATLGSPASTTGSGNVTTLPPLASVLAYFNTLAGGASSTSLGYYAIQCATGATQATGVFDGATTALQCGLGATQIVQALAASTVTGDSSSVALLTPRRFVF